jgi:hypothetical protein
MVGIVPKVVSAITTSGAARVCAFYALLVIVIIVMWRTSGCIGVDGPLSGHRQRLDNENRVLQIDGHESVIPGVVEEVDIVAV